MAGYSPRSLAQKLGLQPGQRLHIEGAPPGFLDLLGPLPEGLRLDGPPPWDLVHLFATRQEQLHEALPRLLAALEPRGGIWLSWPKRASRVPTDITEDRIRDIALPMGLVDHKVCAIDEVWSGLRLCLRRG